VLREIRARNGAHRNERGRFVSVDFKGVELLDSRVKRPLASQRMDGRSFFGRLP
jgi:hypothetical protein